MSLQGTLETIPLPDVLGLLAATKKSGELRVTGPIGEGRLWLDTGRVVAADVPRATTAVDAVFELLRLSAGSFTFGPGAPTGAPGDPLAVDGLLVEAQQRLSAWQAIEAVVPSMACTLRLTPELASDNVTVSRRQWRELVAVAGGGDVNGAMKGLGVGEYDACRTVKELVDAGLVQVGKAPVVQPNPPEQSRPAPPRSAAAPAPAVGTDRAKAPEAPAPARRPAPTPGPVSGPARATGAGPAASTAPGPDRGAASPLPVSSTAPAASGRSAAPRRGPAREEAEEMVQQLAELGEARAKAAPARAGAGKDEADAVQEHKDDGSGEGSGEEPIARGTLLKFLSSVRP